MIGIPPPDKTFCAPIRLDDIAQRHEEGTECRSYWPSPSIRYTRAEVERVGTTHGPAREDFPTVRFLKTTCALDYFSLFSFGRT